MTVVTSLGYDDDDVTLACFVKQVYVEPSRHARAPPWTAGNRDWTQGEDTFLLRIEVAEDFCLLESR